MEKAEKKEQKGNNTKTNQTNKSLPKDYNSQINQYGNIVPSFGFNLCIHTCFAAEKHLNQDQPKCGIFY